MKEANSLTMTCLTVVGFLLLVCLSKVASQMSASAGSSLSISTSTAATCGVGSNSCPTDQMPEASELPTTLEVSTSATSQQTTVPQADTTVTSLETTAAGIVTKPAQLTTPKPQTTPSTTPSPTKSPSILKLPEDQTLAYAPSGTCACDLTAYSCDINCCCDQDCTSLQRTSFSWCNVEGYPPHDNRYCYASKLIFLNNSEHILQQAQSGAFCIVRSNLAGSVLYPPHPIFTTYQEFVKHWVRTHSAGWPAPSQAQVLPLVKPRPYAAGSAMWVLLDNHLESLDLPSSGLTSACSTKRAVQYLLPWSSKCMQQVPYSGAGCERVSSDFHHLLQRIVRSPLLVNQTQLLSKKIDVCPSNVCVPVKYFVCSGSTLAEHYANNCKNISSKKVLFGLKSGVCYGVVKKLRLLFYHNGTEGINHAEAYMWLSNVSLAEFPAPKPLHQSFSVEFYWTAPNNSAGLFTKNSTQTSNASATVDHEPFFRSGNQGYIVGKPVIAGVRVKQVSAVNASSEANKDNAGGTSKQDMIELSPDPNQWLSLPGSNFNGMCDLSLAQRHVVTFGEDLHMSCGVSLTPRNISSHFSCNTLRLKMVQLLLGNVTKSLYNSSLQSDWARVIAAFGSANVSVPQDWVPLLIDNQSPLPLLSQASMSIDVNEDDALGVSMDHPMQPCENVPFGIHIQIMHGLVGTTSNPQWKIFGAGLRFSPLKDVGWSCTSTACLQRHEVLHYRVVSTVKFLDITSPAVTRFAEPPAIHIRLPPDFFYPFMAKEGSSRASLHRAFWTFFPSILIVLSFYV